MASVFCDFFSKNNMTTAIARASTVCDFPHRTQIKLTVSSCIEKTRLL